MTEPHKPSCACQECVDGRRSRRVVLTESMYPSMMKTTYTLLPDAQVLAMKKEDRDFLKAKLLELEGDIRQLQDCAVEVS